jgi:DNA ligase-associated metallophosphoesterase
MSDRSDMSIAVLDWAGREVHLLADRGLYLPAVRALLVADAHLAKAAVFAQAGIPVPVATTKTTLQRIQRMLDSTRAGQLVILGDLWHGRIPTDDPSVRDVSAWRDRNRAVSVHVIPGNHDRWTGDTQLLDAEYHEPLMDLDGLRLRHEPEPKPDRHVIAGHLHPVLRLRDLGRTTVRLPCFHVQPRQIILPAVGAFTGGYRIDPCVDDRVFVCGDAEVSEVRAG